SMYRFSTGKTLMKLPEFDSWTRWSDRDAMAGCERPGVYLLAKFESSPPRVVVPVISNIIYIGETCDQSLSKRWYQFNRSAFYQKGGHSGGWTFADKFCENRIVDPPSWLYVAPLPVFLEEPEQSAYIRFVERWLIWEFVKAFKARPICNSK